MINIGFDDSIRSFNFKNGDKEEFPFFTLGRNSYINGLDIQLHPGNEVLNIHIGNFCSIAYNITFLIDRNHDYKSISTSSLLEVKRKLHRKGQIIIGHDVWIGNNVTILSGVRIGNGSVIGAGTVVTKDVPPYAIVVGNPMKIIRYRFDHIEIKKLQCIKWWNWTNEKINENNKWFGVEVEEFNSMFYKNENSLIPDLPMKAKSKSILFIPDFKDKYPIWEKVLKEYINQFTSRDDVTLFLRIENNNDFNINIANLENIISHKADLPDILVINNTITDLRSLFKNSDYFVTTRSSKLMQYLDYTDEFNVKVVSGVDMPIFNLISKEIKV